ncbi:SulP family inorganic anion transporter [bacterium]|nr:SulP family inorganic anion transporter [bacterium]
MLDLIIKKKQNLKNELLSGLTVALALIPEAIAFSFVAHVDPVIGLYAAFIMGLITAIFGGRPGMISGATGAVAVIFAPLVISQAKLVGIGGAVGYLFLAVILMGIIQIAFGVLKLGKFIRLIPHPVMLGFVNGLAIIIFKAQLSQFYIGTGADAKLLPFVPFVVMIALTGLTMAIAQFLPKITKAIPASLAAIVSVSLISIYLKNHGFEIYTVIDFVKNMDPTKTTISASFPKFALPNAPFSLETLKIILPFSVLAAAVGLIESLMTLTLIDELTDTRGRGNKECIGQGLANIVNGFFGGMGGCAMIGQSMINIRAGGRTRISGITAAVSLLLFIMFGSFLIEQIPLAALVGIMFMVVIGTFEWSSFRIMKKIPKSDAFIIVAVSSITVIVDLAIAVIAGVIISALVFAWEQGKEIKVETKVDESGQKIYKLRGALFFGSVTSFKDILDVKNDPSHVIIDFKYSRVYDHSGLEAIQNIAMRYKDVDKKLHLLNLSKECSMLLEKAENIVEATIIKDLDWHLAEDSLA